MSQAADFAFRQGLSRRELTLWAGAAAVMLAVHAGAAWYLTRAPLESIGDQALAPPLLVELAPLVETVGEQAEPEPAPAEMPIETLEPETETPPVETAEAEPAEPLETSEALAEEPIEDQPVETAEAANPEEIVEPDTVEPEIVEEAEVTPDVILPESDVPLPVIRPEPERRIVERTEPRQQRPRPRAETPRPREERRAERPRRLAPAAASQPRVSRATTANWQRQVQARLNRYKRYPRGADGATGVAQVRVAIDGSGRVTGATVTRSSGNAALDQAATAMMKRAGRVPAPPDGGSKTLVVPVNFSERS